MAANWDKFDPRAAFPTSRNMHAPYDAPGAYGATIQPKVVPSKPVPRTPAPADDEDDE